MKPISPLGVAIAVAQILLSLTAMAADVPSAPQPVATKSEKALPIPTHTIEGVGGGFMTPIAYLVNPGPPGTTLGLPAVSAIFVKAGHKDLEGGAFTETFFQRVELGYCWSRFGSGTLVDDVKEATMVEIPGYVILHNVNLRVLAVKENSLDLPIPAVVMGASYKSNEGIADINNRLAGMLTAIGYDSAQGVDFTLTASKTFPKVFGRSLILSAGLRMSEAAHLGYLGFGDTYRPTFEGNIIYAITPWLYFSGEFRRNANPYHTISKAIVIDGDGDQLVDHEGNWWTAGLLFTLNKHATLMVGWGHLGPIINTTENEAIAVQAKYEF